MHLLHISHRVEDNMILTTTYAENYGREEIHKTLVQMADIAVPANESDVLWRHTTFEEVVSYLVAIAIVLETDSKEMFAIVSVFHLTAETARHVSRYATLTQVLPKSRMAQWLFHNHERDCLSPSQPLPLTFDNAETMSGSRHQAFQI